MLSTMVQDIWRQQRRHMTNKEHGMMFLKNQKRLLFFCCSFQTNSVKLEYLRLTISQKSCYNE